MNLTKLLSIIWTLLFICFYHHMRLLKSSKNFRQIVLMRWINQAFILGPKTWVRLITIKNSLIAKLFTKKVDRNLMKKYFKRMYQYPKWSLDNSKLYFGSIQSVSIQQNICKSTISPLFWSMPFWQSMVFILMYWLIQM